MQFQDWSVLATFAGALAVCKFLTDVAKAFVSLPGKKALGVAICIGIVLVVAAELVQGRHAVAGLFLAILNGVAVGWAASGFNDSVA
jgi:hypothetical protein